MKIFRYFLKTIKSISEGARTRDKFAISLRWFLGPLVAKLGKDCSRLCLKDILVKNQDGIFYCRKKTFDYGIISRFHEEELRKFFLLREGFFIDVGAHIGKYTIMLARRLKNKGQVLAIEPISENFKILEKNISLNKLKNVTALNVAAYSKKGKIKLFSLEDEYNSGDFSIKENNSKIQMEVNCDTLDGVLEKLKIKENPKLVKIDVEGAELEVFKGMEKILKKGTVIIFEALSREDYEQSKNFLSQFQYKIKKISNEYYLAKR